MKSLATVTTLAAFSLVPLTAAACEAYDEAMATSAPPAALASAPPAASKVPTAPMAKASLSKVTKQIVAKPNARVSDAKVAAAAAN